jgi:imidazole glycerol-phosphate synthase subunit HisF
MPICYGGGLQSVDEASRIIELGVEKVALSSAILSKVELISALASKLGSQSVVGVLDVKQRKSLFGAKYDVVLSNGTKSHSSDVAGIARMFEENGVGELLINTVDRDGMMEGYDLKLASFVRKNVNLPLTIVGGAGTLSHVTELIACVGTVGAAAGSMFVYKGRLNGVLINYPDYETKRLITSRNGDGHG